MEGTLLVTPQELKNTSNSFANRGKSVMTITSSMMDIVKSLNSVFEGEAASAYINNFTKLQDDMNQINNKIQEHVTDLIEMADNYERAETTNTQGNTALQSDYI